MWCGKPYELLGLGQLGNTQAVAIDADGEMLSRGVFEVGHAEHPLADPVLHLTEATTNGIEQNAPCCLDEGAGHALGE